MGKVTRRDFIVKGGKYALFTASAMEVLFTSKRAMAQSGLAKFVVWVENNEIIRGRFAPTIARSPSATWHCSSNWVTYRVYHIGFEGNTGHLGPSVTVNVSHSFNPQDFIRFTFGCPTYGDSTINVPIGGGTIGNGGSICSPTTQWINRPNFHLQNGVNAGSGTVTFTATGVQPLTINISFP